MAKESLTLSALILVVFLVRAVFKNRVPKRMLYALWLVVLLKLCLPGTLVSLPVLPARETAAPVARTELSTQPAVPAQQSEQAAAQQPVSPAQEAPRSAAKPLMAAQILQAVWLGGSILLGLWLFGSWLVFTIRLQKSRRFLGKRGSVRIYVSGAVRSPCLAGLLPAVYLTEDVLQTDEAALILRHELTHLRHLDFIWSFCRAAAVTVYWWNPLVWLAAILSKRDAELACDEAVAAGLDQTQRLAYARAILAHAPRKAAALSLAGPPVRERILFLTKKRRTSILCVVLALLLVISAAGCSFAELTRKESEAITLPEEPAADTSEPAKDTGSASMPIEQEEPAQTQLPILNDGSYDPTQPLQAWELTCTNGIQTGMTQAQVEAITGALTPDTSDYALLDDQHIFYRFEPIGSQTPQLVEVRWDAAVENDEIIFEAAQDAPAFRGICLGDTIDDVFDKFPCTDRELKKWEKQYVYGHEGADSYAVLHFIADSFYTLDFYIQGQWRAYIDFSRVQQRVFNIVIYEETYWQRINQDEPVVETGYLRDAALQ